MKKILVLLLALVMLASMVVTASAASITINNATTGEVYDIYKILSIDSIQHADNGVDIVAINYVPASEQWLAFVQDNTDIFAIEGEKNYVTLVADDSKATAKLIAERALAYADENDIDPTATKTAAGGDTATANSTVVFADVEIGYYAVRTSLGATLSIKSVDDDETIEDKNFNTTVTKTVDDAEVAIGDTVTYTITFNAKVGGKDYRLCDKMDDGLTFLGADKITVTGVDASEYEIITDATALAEYGDYTFVIKFNKTFAENTTITVTCQAAVNENAVVRVPEVNTVDLKYGNTTVTDSVEVTTYDLGLIKTNKDTQDEAEARANTLDGAVFNFYVDGVKTALVKVSDTEYRMPAAGEQNTTYDLAAGEFVIKGLDSDDTFYFVETEAPEGYNKVDGNIAATLSQTATVYEIVVNKTGSELPETGGAGTVAFTVVGSLLMLAAVVLFTAKKKMSVQG